METVRRAADEIKRTAVVDSGEAFLRQIEESGDVPSGQTAADVGRVVLCVLSERVSGRESSQLLDALPPSIASLVVGCNHPAEQIVEPFDAASFLRRVGGQLDVDPDTAESLTRVVFLAVRHHVRRDVFEHVASQLPEPLATMWRSP
jgi:uncharacterized protein (DUF2267 family)